MAASPDTVGFAEAQRRLRAKLGVDAVFEIPEAVEWDPDEPIDPETDRPYDPFATPTTGGGTTDITKRCSYVSRPLGTTRDPTGNFPATPIGTVDAFNAALLLDADDYEDVKTAKRVRVIDDTWQIAGWQKDELAGYYRWIIYLQDA